MASSSDPKKVADQVDGSNQVVPAGAEKSKKKGLFGRSSKHEKKAKNKSDEKDDKPPDEVVKEKKSEKAESKKEGSTFICRFYG